MRDKRSEIPMFAVMQAVTEATGFAKSELMGQCRKAELCNARHLVTYVARKNGASYTRIGRYIRRDHTTILNSERRVTERIALQPDVLELIERIEVRARQIAKEQNFLTWVAPVVPKEPEKEPESAPPTTSRPAPKLKWFDHPPPEDQRGSTDHRQWFDENDARAQDAMQRALETGGW